MKYVLRYCSIFLGVVSYNIGGYYEYNKQLVNAFRTLLSTCTSGKVLMVASSSHNLKTSENPLSYSFDLIVNCDVIPTTETE